MSEQLDRALAAAGRLGLDLPGTGLPGGEERPWPVVLLTGLGAWLAALPLLAFFSALLGDWLRDGWESYGVAAAALVVAVGVLRRRGVPLFVEQLAVPLLLVGGLLLGDAFYRDLADRDAALLVAAMALGLAAAVPQAWLRALLGAAAAVFVAFGLVPPGHRSVSPFTSSMWWALHGVLVVGLAALRAQARLPARGALAVEAIVTGWLLALLAGLALLTGMTFLLGGALGLGASFGGTGRFADASGAVSAALAVVAGAWLAWTWPAMRRLPFGVAGVAVAALAAAMPTLGAVLLVAALCLGSGRWRVGAAAALAAVWIVGAFYYRLEWPLDTKAAGLAAAGLVLGAVAWWLRSPRGAAGPAGASPGMPLPRAPWRLPAVLLPVAVGVCVVLANGAIAQKERLIARGEPLRVALAPADPRSLMQGDFMRLAFRLPSAVNDIPMDEGPPAVVFQRDASGVSRALRVERDGAAPTALGAGELRVYLVRKSGSWTLVTDAWFFREGDGARFEAARFGEFRVQSDGRALLVGLLDDKLRPISP